MKKIALRLLVCSLVLGSYVATGALLSGCSAAWWASIVSSPGAVASFLQYVQAFLGGIQALWSTILSLLPASSQQQAQVEFNNAIFSVEQGLTVLQDALNAAAAAKGPQPDLSKLVADVQAAVDALMKIVEQWTSGGSPAAGDAGVVTPAATKFLAQAGQLKEAERQASVIKQWKP